MADLYWEVEAGQTYQNLVKTAPELVSMIENLLDLLQADPGTAAMRKDSLRMPSGKSFWKVRIRYREYNWSLLWTPHPNSAKDVLIVYLGPATYA